MFFERLAGASELHVGREFSLDNPMQIVTDSARIFIPMGDLIDREKELERLNREKAACEKEIGIVSAKLANEKFTAKAPEQVVAQERDKLAKAQERLQKILDSIKAFGQ